MGDLFATDARVGAVVLAAGESSRLGWPKQLLPHRGSTLLRCAVEAALGAGCQPVAVVLGARADQLQPHLDGLSVHVVLNPDWRSGMGSSIRTGVTSLLTAEPDAVVLMVCDQPAVTADAIASLTMAFRQTRAPVVASRYDGTIGVPALFDRSIIPELLALGGKDGARGLIARLGAVPVDLPGGEIDIDTPDDYARLQHLAAP